jgi:hypothetical protein
MKFQKMIRVQLMLVGLGAGLLFAKPVCAQQDTDPTLFEAADATQPDLAGFNAATPPEAAKIVTLDSTAPQALQEQDAAALTAVDANAILSLMVGIGSIVLLGMAEAVRGSRRRTWRAEAAGGYPGAATAS